MPSGLAGAPVPVQAGLGSVTAGFPSPAADLAAKRIDLNDVLVAHPAATFMLRVRGASMREAGIDDGDVILVDRALPARHDQVVVAVIDNGDFTVKRLHQRRRGGPLKLCAANPTYPDIVPGPEQTVEIWGVVTACIKFFAKGG